MIERRYSMTNKIIVIILFTAILASCKNEKGTEVLQNKIFEPLKANPPKFPKEKFLSVHFGPGITLKWDVEQSRLIEDSEYNSIKNDAQKISILMDNISNEEDLNVKVCLKKENLKKGDVAYTFIWAIGRSPAFLCLERQIDVLGEECPYPYRLLGYLEKNRITVKEKVIACQKKLSR